MSLIGFADDDDYHTRQMVVGLMPNLQIVLTFEGLSPAALSCYGSSWNQTPIIDSIAGAGAVWDRCIANSDDPKTVFHRLADRLCGGADADQREVRLLTDDPSIADGIEERYFDRIDLVAGTPVSATSVPQADIVNTQLGQLFAAAIAHDMFESKSGLFWIHSNSLTRCWDAPRDGWLMEEPDREEDSVDGESVELIGDSEQKPTIESPPYLFESVIPPCIELAGDEHPDFVTSWMRTYGCQVQLIDTLIEMLLTSIGDPQPPLLIAGTSGFRLGQGGSIGHRTGPLRSRDVHLPVIWSRPGTGGSDPIRFPKLTSSESVATAIGHSIHQSPAAELWKRETGEPKIEIESARSTKNLATDDWFFVRDHDSTEHLYSKPDDADDFNDVARVRPDIVSLLDGQ